VQSRSAFDRSAIRRDTPIPLHFQMSELLQRELVAGRWKVGERIPGELELCARFDISRTTARKALDTLVNAGYLRRDKGRGTFVADKLVEGLVNGVAGFYDDMAVQGIAIDTQVLQQCRVTLPPRVAHALQLPPDTDGICIERVRLVASMPLLSVISYLPYDLCPTLLHDDLSGGLYRLLREQYGLYINRASRYMEAVPANDHEAGLLGIKPGASLMLIESTSYLEDGRPLEYYRAWHRGDRARFVIESRVVVGPGGAGRGSIALELSAVRDSSGADDHEKICSGA
jgi:GntR family transcriptional regulator